MGREFPDQQVGPVHGAAMGGVVHAGVADAPVARHEHVAGVGEPSIGVGGCEKSRFGNPLKGVGRDGRADERKGCPVEENGVRYEEGEDGQEEEENEEGAAKKTGVLGGRWMHGVQSIKWVGQSGGPPREATGYGGEGLRGRVCRRGG